MKKRKRRSPIKRLIILSSIILIIVIIFFFFTQLYLIARLLLGNDIIVNLKSDKENFFLTHGQSEPINLKFYALANPFCNIECIYEFKDISNNTLFDRGFTSLRPGATENKEYVLNSTTIGAGQKLYRFEVECMAVKNAFCHTKAEKISKIVLITLNYNLNNQELLFKEDSKEKITLFLKRIDYLEKNSYEFISIINETRKIINNSLYSEMLNFSNQRAELAKNLNDLKDFWEAEEYSRLSVGLAYSTKQITELEIRFSEINLSLISNLSDYNDRIGNLSSIKSSLERLAQSNLSNSSLTELSSSIDEFNYLINNSQKINSKSILNLSDRISNISVPLGLNCCIMNKNISNINLKKLNLTLINSSINIELKEPISKCCTFGECKECCLNCSDKNFPIIFIHGHDFSKDVSAEYSLDTFTPMQKALERDGYLNAGSITLDNSNPNLKGIWSTSWPVSVQTSYYFDIFKNSENKVVIQTKTDSIDTYAIRLRDIINIVKEKTGKNKVILISHSMGGLVTRRYLQLFTDKDVDRAILIAIPNHGIDGRVLDYCPIFGARVECEEMDKDSLFINQLNNAEAPKIPIYNIVAVGCNTEGEDGDGIVKASSSYLAYANNTYIQGTCDNIVDPFHVYNHKPDRYPPIYDVVKEMLKQ